MFLRHPATRRENGHGYGFRQNAGFGVKEVYAEVMIWKLD
jgi:hypothetical protein